MKITSHHSTGTYPNIEQKLIWGGKNIEVSSWRKVIVELPNDVDEYRLLFEGEYNKTTNYWTRNFVTIDNLELRSCYQKGKTITSNSLSFAGQTYHTLFVQGHSLPKPTSEPERIDHTLYITCVASRCTLKCSNVTLVHTLSPDVRSSRQLSSTIFLCPIKSNAGRVKLRLNTIPSSKIQDRIFFFFAFIIVTNTGLFRYHSLTNFFCLFVVKRLHAILETNFVFWNLTIFFLQNTAFSTVYSVTTSTKQ